MTSTPTTVYFGTNRNIIEPNGSGGRTTFGQGFSVHGSAALRFGRALVSEKGDPDITVMAEKLSDNPDEIVRGSKELINEMRHPDVCATIVLIHGFNTSFDDSLRSAAAFHNIVVSKADKGTKINIALFSWPSDGQLLVGSFFGKTAYISDRIDAAASGPGFYRGIDILINHFQKPDEPLCNQRMFLVAHSMGSFVLRHGLQTLLSVSGEKVPQVFDKVILVAPDEDNDAFNKDNKLALLPLLAKKTVIYHNENDKALVVSDFAKFNPSRLGSDGPLNPNTLPRGVTAVSVDEVVSGIMSLQHNYHTSNDAVATDIAIECRMLSQDFKRKTVSANEFALMHDE